MTLTADAPVNSAPAGTHLSAIEALTARGAAATWDADTAIDWSVCPKRPMLVPPSIYRSLVSQLYHGERATMAMCDATQRAIPDAAARAFVAQQAADESRHATAYARYLDALGGVAPIDRAVEAAFGKALAWDGPWQGLVIAANVILESETVRLLQHSPNIFSCPLLRDINALVARDEARHLAFGRLYLTPHIAELSDAERVRIYDWLYEMWHDCVYAWRFPVSLLTWVNRPALARLWQRHQRALAEIGLIARGPRR